MGFFANLINQSRDAVGGRPAESGIDSPAPSQLAESIAEAIGDGTGLADVINDPDSSRQLASTISASYRCITLIAGSVSQLPGYLEDADGYRIDDPLALSDPATRRARELLFGGEMIGGLFYFPELIKQMAADLATHGNAFLSKTRNDLGAIENLEYHPPASASGNIKRDKNGLAYSVYTLRRVDSGVGRHRFSARDLVHARLPQLIDAATYPGLLGSSPLAAIRRPLLQSMRADEFVRAYFQAGGFGNQAIISYDQKMTADVSKEVENLLHRKISAAVRRRVFSVLGGGPKITPLTMDTQSAEMAKLSMKSVEEIARAYGVPGPLIGIQTTQVGTGLEELTKVFIRFCLMDYRRAIETAITYSLFSAKLKFKFDVTQLAAADIASLARLITAAQGDAQRPAILTREELRAMAGDIPKVREKNKKSSG